MSIPLRAANLWGYRELARSLGGDPEELLARHRIRPGVEHLPDAFVSFAAFAAVLEDSAAELDCPDFGQRLSAWQGLDMLGPVAVIARNSGTVLEAFTAIARYLYAHSPALLLTRASAEDLALAPALAPEPGGAAFRFTIDDPWAGRVDQAYELSLANGQRILRLLGGDGARPARAAFSHRRVAPLEAYERTFGGPVLFAQPWCGMEIGADLASRRIDDADPATQELAASYLQARFGPAEEGIAARVASLIAQLLPLGQGDASSVASQLRLHPRTLQRRLAAEGTRFATLLDRERRLRAGRLLSQSGLELGQISRMLGYSEQSAFNRAFQRWHGISPGRWRAEAHAGAARDKSPEKD